MMDKRTIAVMVACMLALFGLQYVTKIFFPPIPKKTPSAAATNAAAEVASAATNAPVEKIAPAPVKEPKPRPAEQIVALSNEFIRVEFTSWGGGIRTVELLQHKANGHGRVVLNKDAAAPALALAGEAEEVFALEQSGPSSVVMRGPGVTKTVSLTSGYVLSGAVEWAQSPKSVGLVVGAVAQTYAKEAPLYLNVDWQNGPKWSNRDHSVVTKRTGKGQNHELISARWVAVKNQYFTMVLMGPTNTTSVTYTPVTFTAPEGWDGKTAPVGVSATAEWPAQPGRFDFALYAGPKEYARLAALGQGPGEVMDFGSWMDAYTGIFGMALFKGMAWCHKLIANYGVAIILVTILLRIVFWPIQAKSIKSMKDMQKFQPQMQKVREKFKDDPQRMNQEMMKLYNEHKINPFSGCLPMLVQLPVLIAFYKVLSNASELRGVSFLWIKDLSLPDTVAMVAGFPLNPLPLAMTAATIWQQKITPTTGDSQQQKMMMFMPLIMLVFFYNMASGLVLYWTAQQFLSIAQQWWSMRQPEPPAPVAKSK